MENLEVQNFEPSKVMAHPRVLAWHKFWSCNSINLDDPSFDEMDTEEAISQYWKSVS
ncbi:hypothetical protein BDZ94DRAFT_1269897 [Collybia nuda]|uniref:Uncharacterized protein n=1 Tax=Collybia nuda TaxID=64659 RepID=A0A9P5XXW1_9AGAR|nr:hypothetical protein BDZ94DRAFT_1269897 [Collybia nuda]